MKKILINILFLFLFFNFFNAFSNNVGFRTSGINFTVFDEKNNISISSYWENINGHKKLFFRIYKYNINENPEENNVELTEQVKVLDNKTKDFKGIILKPIKGVLKKKLLYFSTKFNGIYIFDIETKKLKLYFKRSSKALNRESTEEHLIIDFDINNNSLIIATKKGLELYDLKTKKIIRKISNKEEISKINIDENPNYLSLKYKNQKYDILSLPSFKKVKEVNNVNYLTVLENGKMVYIPYKTNNITLFDLINQKEIYTKELKYKSSIFFKTETRTIKSFNNNYLAIDDTGVSEASISGVENVISILNIENGEIIEQRSYYPKKRKLEGILLKCNKTNFITSNKIEVLSKYYAKYTAYYSIPVAHIISVGNNQVFSLKCNTCEKEVTNFANKITSDYRTISEDKFLDSLFQIEAYNYKKHKVRDVKKYLFAGKKATLKNIRIAFREIIEKANPNDLFIFNFSGYSHEILVNNNVETFLLTYQKGYKNYGELKKKWDTELNNLKPIYSSFNNYQLEYWKQIAKNSLTIKELGSLMNQIPVNNQLVISESGNGEKFAQNLIYHLFENNPLLAKNNTRNRLILTTKGLGFDDYGDIRTGPLNYLINKKGNLLDIFENTDLYNYELLNTSKESNRKWFSNYYKIHQEKDYANFLVSKFNNTNKSRGTVTVSKKKVEKKKETKIKSFALLIANDTFDATKNWSSLKNPINDVNAVEQILKEKYNTETLILHNKTKNDILKAINNMKAKMDENDQFLFFIAGHGYYSEEMSDGMVVCKESNELEEDYDKSSYLKMADLHRLLNTMPAKNVFAVFDVCFGATFDLFAKDIEINNYNKLQLDIELEDFIKRKNSETSRIFMASGRYEVPDYWSDSEEHSPFASKLIKAFSEEKDFISPGKIFSYMHGNATEPLLKKFGNHKPRGDYLLKAVEK